MKFAWELPKNVRKVILLLERGICVQNTDRMHVFCSHLGNIHMCLLFLLLSFLALTPLSTFISAPEVAFPSLFPEGTVTMLGSLLLV